MTLRVLGYSGSASGLNGSSLEPFSIESFECFEAVSASGPVGSCSGNVSRFAGGAETTGFSDLRSEVYLPILGSEWSAGMFQLGVEMRD